MSATRGSEVRIKKIALATRWSPAEYHRLCEIAEYNGCSRAEVLRQLVQRDHRNIIPSRELVYEVRRIGNNINQLVRAVNAQIPIDRNALLDVYSEMLTALVKLRT